MIRELWNIGSEFRNEEVFSLSIEINNPYSEIYVPNETSIQDIGTILEEKERNINLLELGRTAYHRFIRRWIDECLIASIQAMKPFSIIPNDFSYTMNWSDSGSIKITGNHQDQLINKKFLEIIAPIFGVTTEEKYILKYEEKNTFATQEL